MISEELKSIPTKTSGVYCMYDLDNQPTYAGQTSKLRTRLRQHFIRQDSSVVSYGRLDIWDIAYVNWWKTEEPDPAEQRLLAELDPYLNFDSEMVGHRESTDIDIGKPDGTLKLVSDEELEFRSSAYNRSKRKLEHLSKMIDKIKLANHSAETKEKFYEHQRILEESMDRFLDNIDDR